MPASDWNAPQQDLLPSASAQPKPDAGAATPMTRKEATQGRTDLEPYSPEWWALRQRTLVAMCKGKPLSRLSLAAADLSAYNGNHGEIGCDEARAAYVAECRSLKLPGMHR